MEEIKKNVHVIIKKSYKCTMSNSLLSLKHRLESLLTAFWIRHLEAAWASGSLFTFTLPTRNSNACSKQQKKAFSCLLFVNSLVMCDRWVQQQTQMGIGNDDLIREMTASSLEIHQSSPCSMTRDTGDSINMWLCVCSSVHDCVRECVCERTILHVTEIRLIITVTIKTWNWS